MSVNIAAYQTLRDELKKSGTTLVAVSKTKPSSEIKALYDLGQRDFGENYVQELVEKVMQLPDDIRWHFIGHLQSNKVKYIAPFVYLIHGVDSTKLLQEVDKQGRKIGRKIPCLLQMHVAMEETKFGLDATELAALLEARAAAGGWDHAPVHGIMGMASFTDDKEKVRSEFRALRKIFDDLKAGAFAGNDSFNTLSMGMSGDYALAVEEGSTMVRVGSLLFGARSA